MTVVFPSSRRDPSAGRVATAGCNFFLTCSRRDADCEVSPGSPGGLCRAWKGHYFRSDSPHICKLRYVSALYIRKPFQNREVGLMHCFAFGGYKMM